MKNIQEIIDYKKSCPLCHNNLIPFLRNSEGYGWSHCQFNKINARLTDDNFIFKIDYTSATQDVHIGCKINCISNEITTEYDMPLTEIFSMISLRAELHCYNKKCNTYYYWSKPIYTNNFDDRWMVLTPLCIDTECFSIPPRFWIQNDLIRQETLIYDINKSDYPLKLPIIDLSSVDKDKWFNRIQTIINFQ